MALEGADIFDSCLLPPSSPPPPPPPAPRPFLEIYRTCSSPFFPTCLLSYLSAPNACLPPADQPFSSIRPISAFSFAHRHTAHSDVKTCKACSRNYQTCRKAQVTASEGVERVKPVDA